EGSDLSCADGFSLRRDVRRLVARGVRAAPARRHGRRSDAVHAPRSGGGGVAVGHADPRTLGIVQDASGALRVRRVGTSRGGPLDRIHGTAMAATVIDRAWRDTTPDAVDGELAALWRDVASRGAVARAVMSNLVVFRFRERRESHRTASASTDAIEAVLARHPSRAILIEHDRAHP